MAAPPGAGQPGLTHSAAPGAGSSFCGMAPSPPRNDDENDELLEIIVFKCREVTVYKIPPRSARGHKAETWEDVLWKGKLEIVTKGRDFAAVRLADSNTGEFFCVDGQKSLSSMVWPGKLFAVCPLPRKHAEAVERTADSSRFFVLRLDNGKEADPQRPVYDLVAFVRDWSFSGRRAYVGIGFQDRNDAFDFACALSDEERLALLFVENHMSCFMASAGYYGICGANVPAESGTDEGAVQKGIVSRRRGGDSRGTPRFRQQA
ncbi:adaptin ear-binding coat-associated protein 2 (necap-2) isoform 2 family protein [Cystoisospora suis]|uniref:Adaptin ear-binding coat-associated protein 2 (Necap-2) isoform 2 family protein n=1 Tax=Cystoisospora suis TaxID=483139 RepID=A0A2C6L702_9APIC|nr:adaptin ear-binding coat-associated protein 2 (necap-2) isoform 2 family protein [Cystoisospora suis]